MARTRRVGGFLLILCAGLAFGQVPAPLASAPAGVYEHVFKHIRYSKQRVDRQPPGSKVGGYLDFYAKLAQLTPAQANALGRIALATAEVLDRQDAQAAAIIQAWRAQKPKLVRGEKPPDPPAELKTLWEERKRQRLAAVDQLRQTLGSVAFVRLDQSLTSYFAKNSSRLSVAANGGSPL